MGPYIPYGLFQTTGETCAKFGSDRFRNVDLYKDLQTNKQTFIFIYKISRLRVKDTPIADYIENQTVLTSEDITKNLICNISCHSSSVRVAEQWNQTTNFY